MPLWYTLPGSAVTPPNALAPSPIDDSEQIDVLLFGSMNVSSHTRLYTWLLVLLLRRVSNAALPCRLAGRSSETYLWTQVCVSSSNVSLTLTSSRTAFVELR